MFCRALGKTALEAFLPGRPGAPSLWGACLSDFLLSRVVWVALERLQSWPPIVVVTFTITYRLYLPIQVSSLVYTHDGDLWTKLAYAFNGFSPRIPAGTLVWALPTRVYEVSSWSPKSCLVVSVGSLLPHTHIVLYTCVICCILNARSACR